MPEGGALYDVLYYVAGLLVLMQEYGLPLLIACSLVCIILLLVKNRRKKSNK